MVTVGSIMTRGLVTVSPDSSVERALWLMRERKLRHLPVMDDGLLVGMLSERDLQERVGSAPRQRARSQTKRGVEVKECMSASLETVTVDESAVHACRRILDRRIGCLPVIENGRLAGVVSEADLLRLYVHVCRAAGRDANIDPMVEACMSREVLTIEPGASVSAAFELCRSKGIRHLPVVQEGWLVGIVSDHDLLPLIGRGEGESRRVEGVMTKDYVAVTGGQTPLSEAGLCMLRDGFHALPVLENGALKGIVTSADVLLALGTIDEQVLESAWSSGAALSVSQAQE